MGCTSVRNCGDGTGNGINVYSYAVNLQVAGGTVTFGAVTSASPFTTDIDSSNPGDGVRNYVSFADASGTGLPEGGPHLLFALPGERSRGHSIDGRSDQGTRLPSGVYFYSIESAEGMRRGRLTVVR